MKSIIKKMKKKPEFNFNLMLLFFGFVLILFILVNKDTFINHEAEFKNEQWKNLIKIRNDYINSDILWLNPEITLIKNNFPSDINFDKLIKQDIIYNALEIPKNYCIIDCGAHIGDGSIPIAHALKEKGRSDILVYAIDPSLYKCEIIKYLAIKNNLNNVIVINCGLSDENYIYYKKPLNTTKFGEYNSGASEWTRELIHDYEEKIEFKTLDTLNINNIGIIHLDVEGMEINALKGAINSINKTKPYLSIENNGSNKDNNNYYLKVLPNGYKWVYNKEMNNCLKYF
jgi:FkbM family methyltransferase